MKKIILIFLLFSINSLTAQVTQEWVATYSGTGSGYNFPRKSAIDNFGNLIVAGNSDNYNNYVTLKYSPGGNLIWERIYNGTGNDYDFLTAMVIDDSDNAYVTGVSWEGNSNGKYNWVTIKYNPNGDTLWKRSFDWVSHFQDECYGMALDKNNNVYITGFCQISSFQYETAIVTIKYNSRGDFQWAKSYFPPLPLRSNWGYSVATDDSNNVYASGYGAVPTGNEIVTIKYDTDGNEKWIQKYPTYYGDYLRPTYSVVDKENNLVVVGYSYLSNNYDFVTLKYSSGGSLLWSRLFAGANDDYANSIFLDYNNNILVGGSSYSIGFSDYLILKYSPEGDTLLIKLIEGGGLNSDQVNAIISDSAENIYVTGFSQSASSVEHYLTIKLNSLGDTLWSKTYRNAFSNSAYCLNLDKNGSVYACGAGGLPGGNSAILTIKYSQLTNIKFNELQNITEYGLYNYPNPFNPKTIIRYKLRNTNYVELKIFDILGNEFKTIVKQKQNPGSYDIDFDGSNLSSGIYFYSLISNGIIVKTNKMLIIK